MIAIDILLVLFLWRSLSSHSSVGSLGLSLRLTATGKKSKVNPGNNRLTRGLIADLPELRQRGPPQSGAGQGVSLRSFESPNGVCWKN